MRVRARIPAVDITVMQPPEVCPYEDCEGRYFKNHQAGCPKPVRDTRIEAVETNRRRCLTCGRTHRVYPQGVSKAHQSDRLKGLSVLLYVLGISYRGVEVGFPHFRGHKIKVHSLAVDDRLAQRLPG